MRISACRNHSIHECVHPFEFDNATHYRLELPDSILGDAYRLYFNDNENTVKQDARFNRSALAIALDNFMSKLSERNKISELVESGFIENEISKNKLGTLDSAFCHINIEPTEIPACEPVYRDLIVLEKDQKIIGWVKICFDCGMSEITGSGFRYDGLYYNLNLRAISDAIETN